MLRIDFQARIWRNYHDGKEYANGTKYRYSVQYNPLSAMPTWIVRQDKGGGEWEFVEPLASNLQFTPCNSKRT